MFTRNKVHCFSSSNINSSLYSAVLNSRFSSGSKEIVSLCVCVCEDGSDWVEKWEEVQLDYRLDYRLDYVTARAHRGRDGGSTM